MALFTCASCGCNDSRCIRTIAQDGQTLRQRRCIKCGRIAHTVERIVTVDTKITPDPEPDPPSPPKKKKRPTHVRKKGALDNALEKLED